MDIAQVLRSEGFKVTPQRIAIYDALCGNHNHPTAEMIYHSLRPTHPSMSLATVYKTMEIFEKIGLVKVLEVGDERAHYDWDTHAHSHVRCIRCNKIEDLMGVDLKAITDIAEQGSDYHITGQQITFEGICPDCALKESH
ncbi:Fur family transcriptional regulator [Veillonella caviae]|uniref:Fur family transcriptional regulator n=1 Tax=Veillonella caviae TaxID=248316 RepID=UPI000F8E42B7|nr:Fur family transcriptional regulator [Veillonella caviae]MCF0158104.1 transcriptional repressor [Veillonella sp.]MCI5708895.1 transcriptional repressor [Veillonella caviae]MCI6407358.1 transcriptional repressor [Veillonella caviae]MCI7694319.1 transcriptional repressor [Veillonella caviae]MDD7291515.1 Fur family transcriptional regulator [Veillonella caviae]